EAELILAPHRPPSRHRRRLARVKAFLEKGMLGRVCAESAGLEEVGDRVTDRHPHDELGHAPLQALVEEVVEQGSAILKPIQIGAQTQVENLPDVRTEGGVFGLDETM